ncbi:MAG: hypothetical protein MK165_19835 [Pirellulaceae bacterium]|nr:hypothetical protein [Pirellulaceae bacterium]
MKKCNVLVVGDTNHEAFEPCVQWLKTHIDTTVISDFSQAVSAIRSGGLYPKLIVIAQSRPGQFSAAEVESLYVLSPLTHLVALLGSWCEGETRSGKPWPGVQRIYWHEWESQIPGMVSRIKSSSETLRTLPRTATRAEELHVLSNERPTPSLGLVAIQTEQFASYEAISTACCLVGHSTVWVHGENWPHMEGVVLGIWDGKSLLGSSERTRLRDFVSRLPNSSVIAMLDFPRSDEVGLAHAMRIDHVISKPFLLEELWDVIKLKSISDSLREAA